MGRKNRNSRWISLLLYFCMSPLLFLPSESLFEVFCKHDILYKPVLSECKLSQRLCVYAREQIRVLFGELCWTWEVKILFQILGTICSSWQIKLAHSIQNQQKQQQQRKKTDTKGESMSQCSVLTKHTEYVYKPTYSDTHTHTKQWWPAAAWWHSWMTALALTTHTGFGELALNLSTLCVCVWVCVCRALVLWLSDSV